MGTLISNPTASAAYDGSIWKKGVDLLRSAIARDLGVEVANPSATIRAGQLVSRDAGGYIVGATGLDVYGVAKWGRDTFGVSVAVDVPVVLNGTTATNLTANGAGRGNVSNVTVRSAANMAGTVYAATTDYTVNAGNGTVTRVALGSITDGQTVYVTYTFALVDADFNYDGKFFSGQGVDRVSGQLDRITVITDWSRIFSIEWTTGDGVATAPNSTYALTGSSSKLYCSPEGKFTNDTTSSPDFVGRVYQLPTAADPYMGVTIHGNPTA